MCLLHHFAGAFNHQPEEINSISARAADLIKRALVKHGYISTEERAFLNEIYNYKTAVVRLCPEAHDKSFRGPRSICRRHSLCKTPRSAAEIKLVLRGNLVLHRPGLYHWTLKMSGPLKDSYNRPIRDLRVSLTDRCNFRCFYCLPHGEPPIAPKEQMLSYEEIEYICEIFVELGIEKIRLTGGEPMIRQDIEVIIRKLAALKSKERPHPAGGARASCAPGLRDLALTTNGYFLPDRAQGLKDAGLDRITISLDSLKRDVFKQMTGVDVLDRVLAGIEAAKRAGLQPIKINAVIVRGHNEDEVADFAAFAREHDIKMRFIEFMPLDAGHDWSRDDVFSGREIRRCVEAKFPLEPLDVYRGSETASRYRFADGAPGEIGIIAPVTEAFCGACSRIRLTADGQIRTCLFSTIEHSLRDVVRDGASRAEIIDFIESVVMKKEPRHFINDPGFVAPSRSMSFIGG